MKHIKIMGILNITPDSFSDGGIYFQNVDKAVLRAKEMFEEGADIVDIGGESTRPGSQAISVEEELKRVIPVIEKTRHKLGNSVQISIDTYKAKVARQALQKGATMVNSLGGMMFDNDIAEVIREFKCPFILYHIKGVPKTMQIGEIIYKNVGEEIMNFFEDQIEFGIKEGIQKNQFILDPGIGFGKNLEQNVEIIKRLKIFQRFDLPIMIGVSRKSHLGTLLKGKLDSKELPSSMERLEASLAETAIAVLNGASIVRTHDVVQTKRFLTVLEQFL